jgi:hypothetical protein
MKIVDLFEMYPGAKFVWLVNEYMPDVDEANFAGVFETREEAVAACRNEHYFIEPVPFGVQLPAEHFMVQGSAYPLSDNVYPDLVAAGDYTEQRWAQKRQVKSAGSSEAALS